MVSLGLAFLLGSLVGSVVRVPVRFLLGTAGLLIGVYWFLSPQEVEAWVWGWVAYLQGEVSRLVDQGVRLLAFAIRSPEGALTGLSGLLLSVGPTYAFWAGVIGRVLG